MNKYYKTAVVVACLMASGCTMTTYQSAGGAKFTRMSLGTKQAISGLKVEIDPETGKQSLEVKSYSTDQAEVAAAVVQAAVQAAAKAVKP